MSQVSYASEVYAFYWENFSHCHQALFSMASTLERVEQEVLIGLRNPVSVYICYHVMTVLSAQKYHNILLKIYSIEEEKIFKNTVNLLWDT